MMVRGEGRALRAHRCNNCDACHRPDCGVCRYCKDMTKFGGCGWLKQTCVERKCPNMFVNRKVDKKQPLITSMFQEVSKEARGSRRDNDGDKDGNNEEIGGNNNRNIVEKDGNNETDLSWDEEEGNDWNKEEWKVAKNKAYQLKMKEREALAASIKLNNQKRFRYSQLLAIRTHCYMDLNNFPHDVQTCMMHLQSYGYDDRFLKLSLRNNELVLKKNPTGYTISLRSLYPEEASAYWPPFTYTGAGFHVTIKHDLSPYLFNYYLPSGCFVVIS